MRRQARSERHILDEPSFRMDYHAREFTYEDMYFAGSEKVDLAEMGGTTRMLQKV